MALPRPLQAYRAYVSLRLSSASVGVVKAKAEFTCVKKGGMRVFASKKLDHVGLTRLWAHHPFFE